MKRRRRATTANPVRHTLKSIYDEMLSLRMDFAAGDQLRDLATDLRLAIHTIESMQLRDIVNHQRAPFDLTMEAFA